MSLTIRQMKQRLAETLAPAVGVDEAQAMAMAIIEDIRGYTAADIAIDGHRELLPETEERMLAVARKVLDGMPLQYAIGKAMFRGRYFKVDSSTLIPRPETSQLVDIITSQWANRSDLHVLDVGTGTGCIAISLALDLPFSVVDAVDISPEALAVARANALALKSSRVNFIEADARDLAKARLLHAPFDIIVSNPPYVLMSEMQQMDARVLDHEPATALFVPDEDPLMFYQPIAQYAAHALRSGGALYFEINPLCASQMRTMLRECGFTDVQLQCDYKGNQRFAIARL